MEPIVIFLCRFLPGVRCALPEKLSTMANYLNKNLKKVEISGKIMAMPNNLKKKIEIFFSFRESKFEEENFKKIF